VLIEAWFNGVYHGSKFQIVQILYNRLTSPKWHISLNKSEGLSCIGHTKSKWYDVG
jgi:hypothetical protein